MSASTNDVNMNAAAKSSLNGAAHPPTSVPAEPPTSVSAERTHELQGASPRSGPKSAAEVSSPGGSPSTSGASATHVARSGATVAPDEIGPAPHFMKRDARVVDVTTSPGFEVARVAFATRLVEIEAGDTVAAALAREPYEAEGGQFVIVGVRNRTGRPTAVEAVIHVENERGPDAASPVFRIAAPGSSVFKGPQPSMGAAGVAPREPRPVEPSPRDPTPRTLMPTSSSTSGSASTSRASSSRAATPSLASTPASQSRRHLPPAPPAERMRSSGPVKRSGGRVKRITATERRRAEWKEMLRVKRAAEIAAAASPASSAPADTSTSTAMEQFGDGNATVTVTLFRTYATLLHTAMAYRGQLSGQVRTFVLHALRSTLETGAEPAASANEVSIVLDRVDASLLMEALRLGRERLIEDKESIVRVLAIAIGIAPPEMSSAAADDRTLDDQADEVDEADVADQTEPAAESAPAPATASEAETEDDVAQHEQHEHRERDDRERDGHEQDCAHDEEDEQREVSVPGTTPTAAAARPVPDDGRPE